MITTNLYFSPIAALRASASVAALGFASLFFAAGCGLETNNESDVGQISSAASSPNLAINKPATGSTACATTEGPAKALNGSVSGGWSDKWCSGASSLWLAVDLGTASQVAQFVIKHAGAGGEDPTGNTRDFAIQVSTDGVNYTNVASITGNTSNISTHSIATISARYVRLAITKPASNTDAHARIYELEVYGPAAPGGGGGGAGGAGGAPAGGAPAGGAPAGGAPAGGAPAGGATGAWKLAWADEFNGSGLPNSSDWTYEVGRVRNNEAQYYTANSLNNARQENGNLVIEARKESLNGAAYTSASLTTQNKHQFQYGRIEVRAKLPGGVGTWPAIWLLGTNIGQVGWPACGEIDVMENVGYEANTVHATVHTSADQNGSHNASIGLDQPYNKFYVYAIEWTPQRLDFYIDSNKVYTFLNDGTGSASWPYSKPEYLILNLAIGGSWGGQQGINDASFPHQFYIDYVRYYTAN